MVVTLVVVSLGSVEQGIVTAVLLCLEVTAERDDLVCAVLVVMETECLFCGSVGSL